MADPSANVFNDRLYIFPSHDRDSGEAFDDDGGHFQMQDYHVLSLTDVEHGERRAGALGRAPDVGQ